jgi:hypothetical protein
VVASGDHQLRGAPRAPATPFREPNP